MSPTPASPKEEKFLQVLHDAGGEVFQVGGPVRDFFLEHATKDNDLLLPGLPF